MSITFSVITFGCQMNVRESQWLESTLLAKGYERALPAVSDIIILNTCSVREKPDFKIKSALARLRHETGNRQDVLVAVLGCVAQRAGKEILGWDSRIRLVAGPDGLGRVPDAIEKLLADKNATRLFLDLSPKYTELAPDDKTDDKRSCYVSIMQGCDNFCSYCIVPFTRGRQRSRLAPAILEECRKRIAEGIWEITLLGQNVNAYGADLSDEISFANLLAQIAELPGLRRLRFTAPHPADMDDESIAVFGSHANICPRLHLPLQSGSDRILKAMRRRYTGADYMKIVDKLRAAIPELALSTDLIVGFPGENDDDFQATLDMMKKCGFVSSYSFNYSDRPGTRASLMPDRIPPEVMAERLSRLQALQDDMSRIWLSSRVGDVAEIIVEDRSKRGETGKNSWQGRDIYGAVVNIVFNDEADHAGEMVNAVIIDSRRHSLLGAPVQPGLFQ